MFLALMSISVTLTVLSRSYVMTYAHQKESVLYKHKNCHFDLHDIIMTLKIQSRSLKVV